MTNSIESQLFGLSGPQLCNQNVNLKLFDDKKPQYSFKEIPFVCQRIDKASFQAMNWT